MHYRSQLCLVAPLYVSNTASSVHYKLELVSTFAIYFKVIINFLGSFAFVAEEVSIYVQLVNVGIVPCMLCFAL